MLPGLVGDDDLGGSDHRLVYARVLIEDDTPLGTAEAANGYTL